MKQKVLLLLTCLMAGIWISSAFAVAEGSDALSEAIPPAAEDAGETDVLSYREYLDAHADSPRPIASVTIPAKEFQIQTPDKAAYETDRVTLSGENAVICIPVDVEQEGLYCLSFEYMPHTSNFSAIAFSLKVNGESQFGTMDMLTLDRPWRNTEEVKTDSRGNQTRPKQAQVEEKTDELMKDPEGRYNEPLSVYFKEGKNEILLTSVYGDFDIFSITLLNEKPAPSYETLSSIYEEKGYAATDNQLILLEAEEFALKSDSSILSDTERKDAKTSPSDPVKLLYNIIPGSRYSTTGQWIEWRFTPEQTGLYEISMRVRQGEKSGFTSNRRLYINGEVVCSECNNITFVSSNSWYRKTLGDQNGYYSFYFEADTEYTLRLEVVPGEMSETTLILDDCIFDLNALYRSVVMVAGTNPDKYRDYKLNDEIPDFMNKVQALIDTLRGREAALLEINSGKSGSALTAIRSLIQRLEKAKENPDSLAKKISNFKSDIESLSAWNMDAKEQPLDLDYIAVHSSNAELPAAKANFFQNIWFEVRRLVASYGKDYGTVGDYDKSKETISVWMAAGRDQMSVFEDLVTNGFTPDYGIQVKTSLVTAGIREAILAGKAPDAIIAVGSDEPVNLASRGAFADLSVFDGFDEVVSRFSEGAMVPFKYKDGYYGLPMSEAFNMMFVRTDIFDELGLEIPQTWEDMYKAAAILQRQNMEIGIPSTLGMYATLLFQNGGSFFSADQTATGFDSNAAVEAFKTWTSFFSEYSFPVTFDLYNRFRSGEMPIGINSYSFYTQLEEMAPEIAGRWAMVPIPGIRQQDGTINRQLSISNAAGVSTAAGLEQGMSSTVILESSQHKQAAWDLLRWFSSADVQVDYGLTIESVMGPLGRYTPANLEAFEQMPWSLKQKDLLKEQWEQVVVIPEIPGNYAVARGINNAFRRTIYDNENPVNMLHKYNLQINKELERKHREFFDN